MNEERPRRARFPRMLTAGLMLAFLIALAVGLAPSDKGSEGESPAFKIVDGVLSEEGVQIDAIPDTNFTIAPENGAMLKVTPDGEAWRTTTVRSDGVMCRDGARVWEYGVAYRYWWVQSDATNAGKKYKARFTSPFVERPEYQGPPQKCPF